mgnify:FL=1
MRVEIIGTGSYLPDSILSNFDLEKIVNTSNEWIVERTGISYRRKADDDVCSSDLGAEAAKIAIDRAGLSFEDIDLIISASSSPDKFFPSTACIIQSKIGAKNAAAFDLQAGCSGFIY